MKVTTLESAGRVLRDIAERTASIGRDWDTFEALAVLLISDAYKAGQLSVEEKRDDKDSKEDKDTVGSERVKFPKRDLG